MTGNERNILLSPLDWGLGHAARCIQLISRFLNQGSNVTVFASAQLIGFLRIRFPDIKYIEDHTQPFSYGLNGTSTFRLASMVLNMKRQVHNENMLCRKICESENFDLIVSDNRYGFRSTLIKSVLITHQLQPIPPGILKGAIPVMNRFLQKVYSSFQEIWVPDFPEYPGLAGRLSHTRYSIPGVNYIGSLSRFADFQQKKANRNPKSVLILTSGPAEHRGLMADKLIRIFMPYALQIAVAGVSSENRSNIRFFESPSDEKLFSLIQEAGIIVSHSGYSTIMDLVSIGRSAVLIPTPGQTEQKYLAELHRNKFLIATSFNDVSGLASNPEKLIENLINKEVLMHI